MESEPGVLSPAAVVIDVQVVQYVTLIACLDEQSSYVDQTLDNLLTTWSQCLKCNRTQWNAVPAPTENGLKRFPNADILWTPGERYEDGMWADFIMVIIASWKQIF